MLDDIKRKIRIGVFDFAKEFPAYKHVEKF
jgi:hypothetical protein